MVIAPELLLSRLLDPAPTELLAWRVVGMMVLAYAPAYWWAAGNVPRARPIVAVGLLGKVMGAAGFLVLALAGEISWRFGWTILVNDVVWLPAFLVFVLSPAGQLLSGSSASAPDSR